MDSSRGTTRRVSTEAVEDEMREKTVEFDFIRETQSYDYAKDQNKSGWSLGSARFWISIINL